MLSVFRKLLNSLKDKPCCWCCLLPHLILHNELFHLPQFKWHRYCFLANPRSNYFSLEGEKGHEMAPTKWPVCVNCSSVSLGIQGSLGKQPRRAHLPFQITALPGLSGSYLDFPRKDNWAWPSFSAHISQGQEKVEHRPMDNAGLAAAARSQQENA